MYNKWKSTSIVFLIHTQSKWMCFYTVMYINMWWSTKLLFFKLSQLIRVEMFCNGWVNYLTPIQAWVSCTEDISEGEMPQTEAGTGRCSIAGLHLLYVNSRLNIKNINLFWGSFVWKLHLNMLSNKLLTLC